MKPMQIQDVLTATGGTLICGSPDAVITDVCTDTRKLIPGALFVPLAGERFDAHSFIPAALEGGCAASLTAQPATAAQKPIIAVADTRRALGDLAAAYRRRFTLPVVGITGSVGKTTVKELTAAVLSRRLHVLKTAGNLNNEIGLPLTLFRLEDSHEAAIIEMGMSGFGEIDALARIAAPNIGIMTNIGLSHIEKLGTQENIYKAKSELFAHIAPGGTVILNGDDPILASHRGEIPHKTITVGLGAANDITAKDIVTTDDEVRFTICYQNEATQGVLHFPGAHNVTNALLACAAGLCLGIPLAEAAEGLGDYIPNDKRMQLIEHNGYTIINDCYNAAPASVLAALRVLCAKSGRKIAVLGDIKELGSYTEASHRTIGKEAAELGTTLLFTFGEAARFAAEAAVAAGMPQNAVFHFTDIDALNKALSAQLAPGDTVLIKASRAMQLERVTEYITR